MLFDWPASRPFEGDFFVSLRLPLVVVVQVKFWRRWAWASAAMEAFAIYVLVFVDFCDLLDFVDIGMFATFCDATGVTELRLMPGLDTPPLAAVCSYWAGWWLP